MASAIRWGILPNAFNFPLQTSPRILTNAKQHTHTVDAQNSFEPPEKPLNNSNPQRKYQQTNKPYGVAWIPYMVRREAIFWAEWVIAPFSMMT